jgi:hypothetical protein
MSYTGSITRPSGLTQRTSTQATRQKREAMERHPTSDTARDRNDTASIRQFKTAQGSVRPQQDLQRQQTQKKAEDTYYVDNDYYSLNPWYEQQPPKPLFGMGRPFPRTVRPGMLWGRKRDEQDQQGQEQDQEQEQDQDQDHDQDHDQGQGGQYQQSYFNRTFFNADERVCLIRVLVKAPRDPRLCRSLRK